MIATDRKPLRIDIGGAAAPYAPDEYQTVDIAEGADIHGDARELPFEDDSVDAIWCSHMLEHMAVVDVPVVLNEFRRVLKPHARAIIRVPNFDYVARYWLTGADRGWAESLVFGLQTSDGEFHKSAHTAGSLKADIEAAGLECLRVEMRWTHDQETLQAVARKPDAVL